MRDDLRPGNKFPDIELPNQDKEVVKLSSLMRGFPTVLIFSRGYYCPKDRRQLVNYVEHLQPELIVNYCKLAVVSVDTPMLSKEVRDGLGATFPFLSDEEKKVITELDIVDSSDPVHSPVAIPYTFVLDRDRTIYKIYNGWWFVGRPTVEELRMDYRALLSRRSDWWYDKTSPPMPNKARHLRFHPDSNSAYRTRKAHRLMLACHTKAVRRAAPWECCLSKGMIRMGLNRRIPTLRIYIAEHCPSCAESRRLAEEVRKRFHGIKLEVIDLDKEESQNLDDVFAVPTYVLNDRTISLGNPTSDQLFSRLAAALL